MSQFSRTWWGQKFISALESFTDSARLGRGRSYARSKKILTFQSGKGKIQGTIRGSVNPYFGVYEEPTYNTEIAIKPIAKKDWSRIIQSLATNASFVSKLLLNEVPENIENSFLAVNQHLLPHSKDDFKTKCSCPDYANPCKHIAGLCYRFASELDENPFLLFELRGISQEELRAELEKTPLGKALVAGLGAEKLTPQPVDSYYSRPQTVTLKSETALREFWFGAKPLSLPQEDDNHTASISGILVKKQGDFPAFWERDNSFIEVMEELYYRVKTKNRDVF
ncbi:MAG: SWIM zinc finger family protein [Microcoleaceae cyanobacterium]